MKIYRISGKTWKDKKSRQYVTLYHASHNKINQLMPRSRLLRTGKTGVFLSPSYKSTIVDWAHYVMDKKHRNHPLQKQVDSLWDKYKELEKQQKVNPTPERALQMQDIDGKMDKLKETTKLENKAYYESISGYKTVYIHSFQCPLEVYEESKRMMDETYENDPAKNFGFWGWGAQVFVEAHNLPKLVVKNVTKMSIGDLLAEDRSVRLNRFLDQPFKLYSKEYERQEAERKKALEMENAKDLENPNLYNHKKEQEKRRKEYEEYWAKNPVNPKIS